jgi:PncC family amidohydrolase
VKEAWLGVPTAVLARCGAVSEEVATAMALGAAQRFGVPLAIAVTGIAGPDGGTEAKPVGTVWLATAFEGVAGATRVRLPGSREEVRMRAAQAALLLALRRITRPGN